MTRIFRLSGTPFRLSAGGTGCPAEGRNIFKVGIWDHEVGFRHLKRVVGMHDPKTRDFERAGMEAWGRLILYNACSLGVAPLLRRRTRGRKHKRRVDLTTAFTGMLRMVRRRRFGGRKRRMDLERSCGRHTHAVIGGRSFDRRRRNKSPAKLGYRG